MSDGRVPGFVRRYAGDDVPGGRYPDPADSYS